MSKKGLFGFIFGSAAVVTTIVITKKVVVKKYETVKGEEEGKKDEQDILDKIKKFVKEKVEQIIKFCVDHFDQIQAVSAAVGLVAGVCEICYHTKKYRNIGKIQEQLDRIESQTYNQAYSIGLKDEYVGMLSDLKEHARTGLPITFTNDGKNIMKFNVMEVAAV